MLNVRALGAPAKISIGGSVTTKSCRSAIDSSRLTVRVTRSLPLRVKMSRGSGCPAVKLLVDAMPVTRTVLRYGTCCSVMKNSCESALSATWPGGSTVAFTLIAVVAGSSARHAASRKSTSAVFASPTKMRTTVVIGSFVPLVTSAGSYSGSTVTVMAVSRVRIVSKLGAKSSFVSDATRSVNGESPLTASARASKCPAATAPPLATEI
mmetsp:Transcript_15420/g.47719  ORF Transcript_15420/g.47719 Transcript_15420/m.47719 type:complete len:209 (+) Transcript_15420:2405-3031(+)